jgi:hypothetical protein
MNSMLEIPIILAARSHDQDWFKILFGVIALFIWVGGAIVSAIKKKAEENRRVQRYGQMPAGMAPTLPPPVPPAVPRVQPAAVGRGKSGRTIAKRVQAAAPPARAAVAAVVAGTFNRAAAPTATATASAQPRATTSSLAPANQIGRLLKRADSLRAALILNEVLSPPLSLRDDRGMAGERSVE